MTKKIITLIIKLTIICNILHGISVEGKTIEEIKYTTDNLNYRTAPSTTSTIVGTLKMNTPVVIVDKTNPKWYKVKINNNYYYMCSDYLCDKKSSKKYLGSYQLTAYCTCTKCTKGLGITASGTKPMQGRTIAINNIPFGTHLYLEGYGEYIVEDRGGMPSNVIDVYMSSHSAACQFGRKFNVNVYILK